MRKCLAWRTQSCPRMSEGLMEKSPEARALGFALWVCRSLAPPPCLTWSLQWEGGATQLFSKLTPEYCSHSRCKHSVENWGPMPRATNRRHLCYSKEKSKQISASPGLCGALDVRQLQEACLPWGGLQENLSSRGPELEPACHISNTQKLRKADS